MVRAFRAKTDTSFGTSPQSGNSKQLINGVAAKGGSIGAPGPVVAGGMLFLGSGYPGVMGGLPGNVLLALPNR